MAQEPTGFETIIEALKLDQLSPEEQEKTLLELNELIFRGSIIRMVEQMDQETKDAFNELIEGDASEEQLQAFITEKVPHADQAVAYTIASLTSDILAVTSSQ
jgi:hypothetical protein